VRCWRVSTLPNLGFSLRAGVLACRSGGSGSGFAIQGLPRIGNSSAGNARVSGGPWPVGSVAPFARSRRTVGYATDQRPVCGVRHGSRTHSRCPRSGRNGAARGEADQRSEPRRAGRRWAARFDAPCRTPQRERSLEASLRSLFNRANGASRPLAQGSPRTRAVPPREFSKRGRPWSGKPRRPLLPRAQQPRSATAQPQLATAPRRSISPRQRANRARSEALPAGVNTRSTGTTCQSSGSPAARNATPRAVASRNA